LTIRKTLQQVIWPPNEIFRKLAENWGAGASSKLLSYVWEGCDALKKKRLVQIGGVTEDHLSIERSITQTLVPEVRKAMPPISPFQVEHGVFEFETLDSPGAQPPEYDISFVMYSNQRLIWPIEAKVLENDGTLAEYIKDINDNFLTCRYGPFTSEGAMLAYLLKGKPSKAFKKIEKRLNCILNHHPDFANRDHRTSDHQRTVPKGKPYPRDFRCHHLILEVGAVHYPGGAVP